MKLINKVILIIFFTSAVSSAQSKWFADDLLVKPFTANYLEPKLGFLFPVNSNELRLDIGNSIDVYRFNSDNKTFSFGADLFTFTHLRSEKDFHFPVDAVDYLFGVNFGYRVYEPKYDYGFRFRISHISAHFVDGHYEGAFQRWLNNRNPIVYSREFIELLSFINYKDFRFYGGFTYLFHVDPSDLNSDNYQLGAEYFAKDIISDLITPFFAYDFKLVNNHKYSANHSLMTGIKFGNSNGKGFSIYLNYYSGNNFHGEYFLDKVNYFAFGMNIDL